MVTPMLDTFIVVPCYNEASRLDTYAFQRAVHREPFTRYLFVDDGSIDQTRDVLEGLRSWDPERFAILTLAANQGKAEAVRRGLLHAMSFSPVYVGYWDADLATPLETISDFRTVMEQNPELHIVLGARVKLLGRHIQRRAVRHWLGRIFATGASLLLNVPVYDTQCGAKLFRNVPAVQRLFTKPFHTRWIFDVELLARFMGKRAGERRLLVETRSYEFPLKQWCDVDGSKLRVKDFFRAFFDLLVIYWKYLGPASRADFSDTSLLHATGTPDQQSSNSPPPRRAAG
jgi:dolichyl-phosphate beta-glucosyltransferase